jgi:hypothetical protein
MPALGIKSAVGLVATVAGTCSGHGVCIPAHVHFAHGSCKLPWVTPTPFPVYPLAKKDATCLWPPFTTALLVPIPRTVLVNGQIPLCMGDVLVLHPAACANALTRLDPSGDSCARLTVGALPCGELTAEDKANAGAGHSRIVKASAATVLIMGRPTAVVGDPLGPPCLSLISTGSLNVMAGTGVG